MPKQLDYCEKYKEFAETLENNKSIVLATSHRDKVMARTVYYALHDSSLYFLTSSAYAKYKQIARNQNVALCLNNIQIEGVAHIKGHPSAYENKAVLEHLIKRCPENNRYVKRKNTVLVEVKIGNITMWNNNDREYINPAQKSAYRVG